MPLAPLQPGTGNTSFEDVAIAEPTAKLREVDEMQKLRAEISALREANLRAASESELIIAALRADNSRLRETVRQLTPLDVEHYLPPAGAPLPPVVGGGADEDYTDEEVEASDKENCSPDDGEPAARVPGLTEQSALRVFAVLEDRPVIEAGSEVEEGESDPEGSADAPNDRDGRLRAADTDDATERDEARALYDAATARESTSSPAPPPSPPPAPPPAPPPPAPTTPWSM